MHKNAFTLIELLIVISIIGIIGLASITGFSRMAEVQDIETTINAITNELSSYDRAVSRHEITSYDAVFEAWRRRCTIEELNIDKGVATTPLFWRVFNPVGVFAVMAIIAGIFAAKRGYFSNLFSSQSWLKLN